MKKYVEVEITDRELLMGFVERLRPLADEAGGTTATLYYALSYLVGLTAREAVGLANNKARRDELPLITVKEFRRWFVAMSLNQAV